MNKDIQSMRRDFSGFILEEFSTPDSPFQLFQNWWNDATQSEIEDINAMALATASKDGRPEVRMVLLKGWSELGFDFYTNYGSQKSQNLIENPQAEILFWWSAISRQIRIKGHVTKLSREESQEYFAKRPRLSQLSALASDQSRIVPNRQFLENKIDILEKQFENQIIPCPADWGGFRLSAESIEFWQGQPNRLHDRLLYQLKSDVNWEKIRLAP